MAKLIIFINCLMYFFVSLIVLYVEQDMKLNSNHAQVLKSEK